MNVNILQSVQTPAYVFSIDDLKDRVRMIRNHLDASVRLVYAMKANPFLAADLMPLVDGFEVCSPGEEHICERLGVPGHMLILSGVNKDESEFLRVSRHYGSDPLYTVESEAQMCMLERCAAAVQAVFRVVLRLSDGSQFGMDEQVLRRLIRERDQFPHLEITGVHMFNGTQKKDKRIRKEIEKADRLLGEYPFLSVFEYGPGLSVSYFLNEDLSSEAEEQKLSLLHDSLSQMQFSGTVNLEIGRFLAAECGSYITRVADVKCNEGMHYAIVDGGIHQMNYYGQAMAMKFPQIQIVRSGTAGDAGSKAAPDTENPDEKQLWTICGSLCTYADVLVRGYPAPPLSPGDLLVFARTGAYSVTEGISLFLSRDLTRVYTLKVSELTEVRGRILTEEWNYGRID